VPVSSDTRIGSELFGYRLEALLGRGGMGVVYRAHDLALDRKVALKLLAPELAEDERFRSRFLRESRVAASLDHPNVIPIYEAGEAGGLLCIAMRYVEGTDLKTLLRSNGVLDPEPTLAYCKQVAAALDAAHEHGLVHRDVKPSNVLIARGGHCYLADFGLTQDADRSDLTLTGQVMGSVDYAAPEQIEGKPVDGRADVYSLGCLLYECLTGSVPFPKDSDMAVLWAHVNDPPPRLEAHPTLEPVLKRALAKRPGDRYQTCGALVDAAQTALPKPEPAPPRRRHLLGAIAALVLAGGLAAGLALALTDSGGHAKPSLVVRNNTLVRIDPKTNKITAVTPAGVAAAPLQAAGDVAVGGGRVWVYNWGDNTVSAVDSRTNTVERVTAIGGIVTVLQGNSIAADAGGAWVLSSEAGSGVLTRVRPGLVPGLVTYARKTTLGYDPLAVAAGAGEVWVAAKNATSDVLLRVDPRTGSVLRTVRLTGGDALSIAVGDGAVWVLQTGTISRLDPATGRVTSRLHVPPWEFGQIAVGDAGVWATGQPPNGVKVLVHVDPRGRRLLKTIPAPDASTSTMQTRLAVGESAVWWNTTSGTIWRVDPKTDRIVRAVRVIRPPAFTTDPSPLGIAAGAGAVWVTVTIGP
jgi:YVTN family beta-propeller protein